MLKTFESVLVNVTNLNGKRAGYRRAVSMQIGLCFASGKRSTQNCFARREDPMNQRAYDGFKMVIAELFGTRKGNPKLKAVATQMTYKQKAQTLLFTSLAVLSSAASSAKDLPSTAEFTNLLRTCASNADIELTTDLVGSIATIYDGQRTQGTLSFKTSTAFLSLIPEAQRLEAYKVYTACILKIVNPS